MTRSRMQILAGYGLASVCAPWLLTPSHAQSTLTENLVVPYTGVVDQDGIPFDGETQLRFRLLTVAQGGALPGGDCVAQASCVWEEAHPHVRVHGGAFSVLLGRPVGAAATAIGALLKADTQYYLEVAISPVGAAGWTTLGRQALHPVPAAVWSAPTNLDLNQLSAARADVADLHANQATVDRLDAVNVVAGGSLTAPAFTATGPANAPKLNNVFVHEDPCGTGYLNRVAQDVCHRPFAGRICWLSQVLIQNAAGDTSLGSCAVGHDANN
jgi:hypothetical protein